MDHGEKRKELLIEEFSGDYGSFTLSERLLQKIWMRRDFDQRNIMTLCGKQCNVIKPGAWNLHEGPDFRNAVIELAGQKMVGDVEIHFVEDDWIAHRHFKDKNYANVILHVLLFRPLGTGTKVLKPDGSLMPTVALIELLTRSLEEYAMEDAVLFFENRDYLSYVECLLKMTEEERQRLLISKAYIRWEQKLHFAKKRLEHFGWTESLHQLFMEALGFHRNRVPMSKLSLRYPLRKMAEMRTNADDLFISVAEDWKLSGVRPANHPRRRLNQYLTMLKVNDWPDTVFDWLERFIEYNGSINPFETAMYRKEKEIFRMRKSLLDCCFCNAMGGSRVDTIFVNVMLPLFSAAKGESCFRTWFHWFSGDAPSGLKNCLRQSQVTDHRHSPMCNGWEQSMYQILFEGE